MWMYDNFQNVPTNESTTLKQCWIILITLIYEPIYFQNVPTNDS